MKENETMDDEFEEDDLEEEKVNPIVAGAIFLGLIVAAAIICVVLWSVTHKNGGEPADRVETVQETGEEKEDGSFSALETKAVDVEENGKEASETETIESEMADTEAEPVSGNESMEFAEADDTVTSKDVTNLRSQPSTADAENIVAQLSNGEKLSRTGINETTGWSRLDYNGQTVYAVSGYLTTDLEYTPPVEQANSNRITTQDGRVIVFTDCDDYVTPKEYVNLRTEPSTSQGDSTVKCQITHADTVHRTGYSADSGWSRVEFYNEVLYVVSSYVYNKEQTE